MNGIIKSYCPLSGLRVLLYSQCRFSSSSSNSNQDYYNTLGIPKGASNEQIKKAYYQKSMKYHPDKELGSKEMFREINSAYEVLGNPRLRRMYDKGLISSDPNAVYESEGVHVAEAQPSQHEPISMPHLDQWSKDHYSATFFKDQERKSKRKQKESFKKNTKDSEGSNVAIWIVALSFVCLGYFAEMSMRKQQFARRAIEKPSKS